MTRETIKFLWDIINDGSLQDIELQLIQNLLKISDSSAIDPKDIFNKYEGQTALEPEYKVLLDYRIKKIAFDDFRTFPHHEGKSYGLDFCNSKGEVNSLLLIGGNGTGKSSVFSALEKAYTGFSSQAEERQVNQDIYTSYGLKKKTTAEINQAVRVTLVDECGHNDYTNLTTSASFCSTYDIQQIEQGGEDMTDYILRQLGYSEILDIEKMLAYVKSTLQLERSSIDKSALLEDTVSSDLYLLVISEYLRIVYKDNPISIEGEEKFINRENIKNLLNHPDDTFFNDLLFSNYWKSLLDLYTKKNLSMQGSSGLPSIGPDQTLQLEIDKQEMALSWLFTTFFSAYNNYKKLSDADKVLTDLYFCYYEAKRKEDTLIMTIGAAEERRAELENRDKAITSLQERIISKKESIVNDFSFYARSFIERILTKFAEADEVFKIKAKNGLKVNIHVSQEGTQPFRARPHEYLNSFRFVLFCVTLKVALSLWQMKSKKVVTPIVIDDVFDVSDFENSLKLEEFFYWLICSYKETALSCKIKIPMQLILLTHDELMKTSFERAIQKARFMEALDNNEKKKITSQVIYGRLVKYQYAEQIDHKKMNDGKLSGQTDILNLYYVI